MKKSLIFIAVIVISFLMILFIVALSSNPITQTDLVAMPKADKVLVNKSEGKLQLSKNGQVFKEYQVVFGANPVGHKVQEGDEKTPEGQYLLDYKKKDSSFYRAIHISYPNQEDLNFAKKLGVSAGGQIMIHGQKNNLAWLSYFSQHFNWTDGCIAVTNADMDELWSAIDIGTIIAIKP